MTYVVRPGGVKKYLYAGNRKENDEEWTFTPKITESKCLMPGVPVDINEVWSIRKNVKPASQSFHAPDRLNHNVNKGYYSRHGGMKDGGKNAKPPEKTDLGSAWTPARGSATPYSYAAHSAGTASDGAASSGRLGKGQRSKLSEGHGGPLDDRDF